METELEAKWLNINIDDFRKTLEQAGAVLIHPERPMIRTVFDYPDKRLTKLRGWVRVRDEGDKLTMSYKQLNDRTLHGTKEVTISVNNYESACTFLQALGLESYAVQETKRESWRLGEVEIEIDTWPWIPSFIEVEAPGEQELKQAAEILGLDYDQAMHGSVETAYQAVYDVTEEEIDSWQEMRFSEVPDWLAAKARQA